LDAERLERGIGWDGGFAVDWYKTCNGSWKRLEEPAVVEGLMAVHVDILAV